MRVYRGQWRKPLKQKTPNAGTKNKAQHKRKFLCNDGPLSGQSLFLTDGISAIFTINGVKGRYNNGDWEQC